MEEILNILYHLYWCDSKEEIPSVIAMWFSTIALIVSIIKLFFTLMELKYNDVFFHINQWHWGESVDIVKDDGTAIVCVKFDEKTFPKAGYICDLSVLESERKKGLGDKMMKYALMSCADHRMTFARLYVDAKNIWLREWYERLGFKELSRDENEIELIKEL